MGRLDSRSNILRAKEFAAYKSLVQYALFCGNFDYLNAVEAEELEQAKEYARYIDQPQIVHLLDKHRAAVETPEIPSRFTEFSPPRSNDPLVASCLEALCHEFFSYLESTCVAVHYSGTRVFFEHFEDIDFAKMFHTFLKARYDDKALMKRWSLVREAFRLPVKYYDALEIRDRILRERIPLEILDHANTFGDDVKEYCLFCGRIGRWREARGGFVDFAKQRPQSSTQTTSPNICSICLFASLISPVRTSEGAGSTKASLIALKTTYRDTPATYIYNRLLGMTTGNLVTIPIKGLSKGERASSGTLLTFLSASQLPKEALLRRDFQVTDLSTNMNLDKKKILAIKAFESILGLGPFWRHRKDSDYRKTHYEIHKGNYYALFGHLAGLLRSIRRRNEILEKGIYRLLKWKVIKTGKDPEIVFGMALLIDSFMPEQWQKGEELKTEARKVAFYLEKPEEVLLRLRQMSGRDYATIRENFRNKASFMLLDRLLTRIHDEEGYGDFKEEQEERRSFVESKIKKSLREGRYLLVGFDDIIKVYLYIQKMMSERYGSDPRRMRKKYSDFMTRVKYALIARRPELAEGGA